MSQDTDIISIINTRSIILRYIKEIIAEKLPLIISQSQNPEEKIRVFNSTILKIDYENMQLILHQSLPASWKQTALSGQEALIKCHLNSCTLTFTAVPSYFDEDDKLLYSRLSFPTQVRKKQLRSSFRVSLLKHKSEISLKLADDTVLHGKARDLSLGGGLCQLETTISEATQNFEHFQIGAILEHCRLKVAGHFDISCSAKISHIEKVNDHRFQLGLKFMDLEAPQISQIRQSINKLERFNISHT